MSAVKLNYRKYGKGPVLIILHGLYGSSDNWISIARGLSDRFTVLLPDLRNHGASPHTLTHTYEEMVEDLLQFYEDTQTESAFLIGHSMGGKVAMWFASQHPEKVNHLMVVDIAPKNYLEGDHSFQHIRQHQVILDILKELDLTRFESRKQLDDSISQKIKEDSMRLFLLKNIHRNSSGPFEWKMNAKVLIDSFNLIIEDVNEKWFDDRKPILSYPVTFIHGLNSEYIIKDDFPLLKNIYPEAGIVGIPNAGHWLHAEQPEAFIKAVSSTLFQYFS